MTYSERELEFTFANYCWFVNNRLKFEIEIIHDLSCHPIQEARLKNSRQILYDRDPDYPQIVTDPTRVRLTPQKVLDNPSTNF